MGKLARVVLVGRTNVGKSTIFNRLASDSRALTHDTHGVTRDIIVGTVEWAGRSFSLIDTGGVDLSAQKDVLTERVSQRITDALDQADLLLFVCDGSSGITSADTYIAQRLRKMDTPVVVVVNKCDRSEADALQYEVASLGFKIIVSVSAQHARGIGDLVDVILASIPTVIQKEEKKDALCRVTLLGKPNVGKSSLLNCLVKRDAAIVSEIAGTTRETLLHNISFYSEEIVLADTPGLARKKTITKPLEKLMAKSALDAIDDADIVLLLIDSSEGRLSDQELKLAFYAFEKKHKALVVLYNKHDVTTEDLYQQLRFSSEQYEHLFKRLTSTTISCKTGKNIGKVVPHIAKISARYKQSLDRYRLSKVCLEAITKKPLYHKTNRLIVKAVKQVATGPITILLTVNQPDWFGPSQLRFFENTIRGHFDLDSVPIRFVVRKTFK